MSSSELRIEAAKEERSEIGNGSMASASHSVDLTKRRVEFHPARKPFNGFKSCSGGNFRIETLNPGPDPNQVKGLDVKGRKVEGTDMRDNGLDPVLSLRITFRKIVSFFFCGLFSVCNIYLNFKFLKCLVLA